MNIADVQVISDGRAASEGIRPNDRILSVNGKNTCDLSPADLHRLIKRSTGILRLQVERYVVYIFAACTSLEHTTTTTTRHTSATGALGRELALRSTTGGD